MQRTNSLLPIASLVGVVMFFFGSLTQVQAETPIGQWMTEGDLSRVEIFQCEEALCGRIVWLKEPNSDDGKPKVDINNEDEALRSRAIMGLEIVGGFIPDGRENRWRDGTIYNPQDGKTYQCTMKLKDSNTLQVRGYVLVPILGKTQTWTRHID